MTILSPPTLFSITAAGLNVPAASHPAPRGAITGMSDNRRHASKGRCRASCAGRSVSNPTSIRTLAKLEKAFFTTPLRRCSGMAPALARSKNGRADPLPFFRSAILNFASGLLFIDRLLEFGSRGKLRDLPGSDLDSSSGLRVAPVPCLSCRHRKSAEAYQSYPISFAEGRRDAVHGGVNRSRGLCLADFTCTCDLVN